MRRSTENGATPALLIDRLTYRYPGSRGPAVRELSAEIAPGEFVLLAGRSGSGKSTLLRAACGLVPHFHGGELAGSVAVGGLGTRENGPADLAGRVGFIGQDPETQIVSSTVRAEIELSLELLGEAAGARARAVEEVAAALAIPHVLDRATDALSSGELQRVALAAALVGRPPLLLLDEPASQLDPVAGDELISLLRRLNEDFGVTILVAEHRLERCIASADRVLVLAEGSLAFDGSPREMLSWSLDHDPALATPAARLFAGAGIGPPPIGVKQAREGLGPEVVAVEPASYPGEPALPPRRRSEAAALEVRDLWVELDDGIAARDVIKGLDLTLGPGRKVALMGRNGAGKSTLLRAVAGVLKPIRGRLVVPGGCALLGSTPADQLLHERVAEELPGEAGRRALATVGLEWALERDPRDLSGGERQRLALAIVMAGRGAGGSPPGLVCLDEPTRGMDRARKDELGGWIGSLADAGSTVVVATHDSEFVAGFADEVVLIGEGRVLSHGPPADVLGGGWYFSTEVARILPDRGAVTVEDGVRLISARERV